MSTDTSPSQNSASFRVIRVSEDYGVAVLVSPEDADPKVGPLEDYDFYLHHDDFQEGENFFWEVSADKALGFLTGHADGLGWGKMPEQPFSSLADAEAWLGKAQEVHDANQ